MTKLLLIDVNVLGIGAMREHAYRDRSHRGKATGAIHGTLDKLASLLKEHDDHLPLILRDDRCRWREAILPQYKRHRWATPEQQAFLKSYLEQAAVVRELVGYLGLPQVFCPDFEADDLAGLICRGANHQGVRLGRGALGKIRGRRTAQGCGVATCRRSGVPG